MKNNLRKIGLSIFATIIIASASLAQFEGEIVFEKNVGKIHVTYKYFVKGNDIRIEEVGEDGTIDGIQLMDLAAKKTFALSPERKLWFETPNRRPASSLDVDIKNTGKTKDVLGKKCFEVIVVNKVQDRSIVYWITKGDYNFFIPMLETLNRKENQALFYLEIEGMENHFPMLSTEYILSTGAVVSTLVRKINKAF
jgi:DNA-dependent RNA polymerase auxiliary subunit epsilon